MRLVVPVCLPALRGALSAAGPVLGPELKQVDDLPPVDGFATTPTTTPSDEAGLSAKGCCQTHDRCYDQAKKLDSCKFLLDNPYTKSYSYKCSGSEIVCNSKNKPCQAFICECDRNAAICFSKAPYNKEHKNLNTKKFCRD
ncbi:PREDICTED: phospholipase A2 [Myotis davidii]|uniref:phospholipase A2 n=1 Tax=Myotis davidii TaxID=225400 RepID=UPI0003EC36C0|nr:PREDICTED: phospholipase A2 [Myotis davidii]